MKRLVSILAIAVCVAACIPAAATAHYPAQGHFGIHSFDVTFENQDGTPATQAGSHPFAMTTSLMANIDSKGLPEGRLRDFFFEQIPGLVADLTAYPRCTSLDFLKTEGGVNACPRETALGIDASGYSEPGLWQASPVFNLVPPPGALLRLGFLVGGTENIIVDVGLSPNPPYRPIASVRNTPQLLDVFGSKLQLWGDPSSPTHDGLRGVCGISVFSVPPDDVEDVKFESESGKTCPVLPQPKPLLTLPTDCSAPLFSDYRIFSWEGAEDANRRETHDSAGNPQPFTDCGGLPSFHPSIAASPTSKAASSPTGLDVSLEVDDEGLVSTTGRSQSDIKKVVLTLPEGMTANPSVAEGLEVCSEKDLENESLTAAPGEGCPEASKLGTVEVQSPLVEEPIRGALYQATPFANLAGNSLLAFYIVLKSPKLGIIVKQASKVEADPKTGQLVSITDEIPQVPFSSFRVHLREGGRSPLVSPPHCGTHTATAQITPWSGAEAVTATSSFQIISGPNEGPCPPSGTPPFQPGFEAGSQNNAAAAHSPFSMRLTRRDGDQDLTRFDATLPPGVSATLAGVTQCPAAQIALAKRKTGLAELRSPSCPSNSKIGSVQAGAGVGSQLTYVPGSVYLGGPFGGAPISAVAVVPAVAGPFDIGTVVTQEALVINPRTGEVTADGARSDPIPHILQGIPLVVRDIQIHVDRQGFSLNPTSCDRFATEAKIWGGGSNLFSTIDDSPVARQARYQAASCSRLGFKPSIDLKLNGGTKRGAHPKLRFTYRPRPGDANLRRLSLRFPHSVFLDQAHIRTICTRVQYAAGAGSGAQCPKGSVYGHARVFTPLLSEPLEGPIFLRSSSHNLPDVVLSLHGPPSLAVDVEVPSRIDSIHGGLRAIAEATPDLPVTKAVVNMQGAKKGLIVNSTDICVQEHRANVGLDAHNGKQLSIRPLVRAECSKRK